MCPGDGQAVTGTGYRHTPLSRRPARVQSMMKFKTRANERLATDQDPCGPESAGRGMTCSPEKMSVHVKRFRQIYPVIMRFSCRIAIYVSTKSKECRKSRASSTSCYKGEEAEAMGGQELFFYCSAPAHNTFEMHQKVQTKVDI